MALESSPYILYSDGKGNIFEDNSLYVAGRSGWDAVEVPVEEWIELPDGGQLYELPGRKGIGINVHTGEMQPTQLALHAGEVGTGHSQRPIK